MNDAFQRLEASIRQAGKILRNEIQPSRLFQVEIDELMTEDITRKHKTWGIYIVDEDDSLIPRKIYEIEVYGGLPNVLVTDEDGEALFCPKEWFVPIEMPMPLSQRLAGIARTI